MTSHASDDEFETISNANHSKITEKMEKVSENSIFFFYCLCVIIIDGM